MTDTEIHNGLSNSDLRDYISDGMAEYHSNNFIKPESPYPYDVSVTDKILWRINNLKQAQIEIDFKIKAEQKLLGVYCIMALHNWKDFDTSDYIPKSGNWYRNFIGTDKEYKEFLVNNNFTPKTFLP